MTISQKGWEEEAIQRISKKLRRTEAASPVATPHHVSVSANVPTKRELKEESNNRLGARYVVSANVPTKRELKVGGDLCPAVERWVSANVPTKRELKALSLVILLSISLCFSKCPYEEGTERNHL